MMLRALVFLYFILVTSSVFSKEIPIIVISAGKTPQSYSTVGSQVTVIDSETIENSSGSSLIELLDSEVQGLNIFQLGGKGTNTGIEMRGLPKRYSTIYIDGVKPWAEREWLGKIITINNINFKVEKNIPRCVAINLKPKTDDNSVDLLRLLKKIYNHYDMGIFLTALEDGEISVGNSIKF